MTRWMYMLIAGALLLLVQAHADYLYQASLWEWWTWLDLTGRAPHWPWYADWIPHDAWHIVQSVRNHAALIGAALVFGGICFALPGKVVKPLRPRLRWVLLCLAVMLAVYAVTRAIGFTLVYEIMN